MAYLISRGEYMTEKELINQLKQAIERYCDRNKTIDRVTAKKLVIGDKKALNVWIENTNMLLEEAPGEINQAYFDRTAKAIEHLI